MFNMKCQYKHPPWSKFRNFGNHAKQVLITYNLRGTSEEMTEIFTLKANASNDPLAGLSMTTRYQANIIWDITNMKRHKDRYTNTDIPLTQDEIDVEKVKIK